MYKRKIMGIINANDDSFFSASRFLQKDAIDKIESMIKEGASIIDIGAVSSKPNATVVSEEEELSRFKPIADAIAAHKLYNRVDFSIDSYTPSVVEYALKSGFCMVNDITALADDRVCELASKYKAQVVIMHMQNTPQTMQNKPEYSDVVSEIKAFLQERISKAKSFGIQEIIVDVGIGFGKSVEHNLTLLRSLDSFNDLGCEVLVGASRKSLIDAISPSSVEERLAGSIVLHVESLRKGASILRVHDVFEHVQALKVFEALEV